jgi:hypothetical protein
MRILDKQLEKVQLTGRSVSDVVRTYLPVAQKFLATLGSLEILHRPDGSTGELISQAQAQLHQLQQWYVDLTHWRTAPADAQLDHQSVFEEALHILGFAAFAGEGGYSYKRVCVPS